MSKTSSWVRVLLLTASGVVLGFGAGAVYAATFAGEFPTGSLNRCHLGSYATNCSSAASVWSSGTDLTLGYSCSSLNLYTLGYNYGATDWYGMAYICSGPSESDCNTTTAVAGSYTYAEARNNEYYLSSWTSSQRQFNCTHELGHCWGLAHDSSSGSVMKSGKLSTTTLNSTNKSDVNAKY